LPSSITTELDVTRELTPKKKRGSTNTIPHRADVVTTLNMYQVTPRSIGYAAVQVRCSERTRIEPVLIFSLLCFALQSAAGWCEVYDGFNYKDLYWFIVEYLGAGSAGAKELLDWWNELLSSAEYILYTTVVL